MKSLLMTLTLGPSIALAVACGATDSSVDESSAGGSGPSGSSSTGGTSPGNAGPDESYDTVTSSGEFSFFVISWSYLKLKANSLSCDSTGNLCSGALGGNLGGLDGADRLCVEAAQAANPGDRHQWRAYLSTSSVDAKDRIGRGPWYSAPPKYQGKSNYASDGLLFGTSDDIFSNNRPGDATTIVWKGTSASGMGGGLRGGGQSSENEYPFNQCYTDEFGVCVQDYGDSHDTMTGTTTAGTKSPNTCDDWTSAGVDVSGDLGHSWPRQFGDNGSGMNWSRSNETHACAGMVNLTSTMGDRIAAAYQGGIGSEGGYGAFYCFAYVTGSE